MMHELMKYILRFGGIYLLWIFVHFVAAHLYIYFCVSDTLFGFLISPFLVPTPHCCILRWALYQGAENINIMWLLLSSFIVKLIRI